MIPARRMVGRSSPAVVPLVAAALALLPAARSLAAQDTPPSAWGRAPDASASLAGTPTEWLGAWSPLRPVADVPRGLLRAPLAPGVLDAPPPPSGAFVLSGAPGGLARDLAGNSLSGDSSRFSELRLRGAGEQGDFRRPFDFGDSRVGQLSGHGWAPVGRSGVAIGRFVLDRETSDESGNTTRSAPYGGSPFVIADSVTPPMRRTRARLEGALGWRLGQWGVGGAAGIDSREQHTVDFPLRRTGRDVLPAIMLGADRGLPWLGLRIGAYWRWTEPIETNLLNARPAETQVYPVQGIEEPQSLHITSGQTVFTRIERHATATGGSMQLDMFGARVVVTHERGDRAEDQFTPGGRDRIAERWRAEGSETRAMLQRRWGRRVRVTLVASDESANGDATRPDLTGVSYRGSDRRRAAEADVRSAVGPVWDVGATGGATQVERTGVDFVATDAAATRVLTPFGSAELARRWSWGALALGASGAWSSPSGNIPSLEGRGPYYRRFIAPTLAYEAADASAVAGWVTATVGFRGAVLLGSVRAERASPSSSGLQRLQPQGERSGWSAILGLRL